ncbi:beta-ketoacyl synthase N-terminal-like domain-containing protein [Roseivirga sp. BDSF3-8]|uniref:type I polyketide synthase n=1 Tax=Roseivirga sp. BDSF3-8 TaxID=3241598 RepID=UPI00353272EF
MQGVSDNDIAIIGMAGRFPKAGNISEYWQNLVNGVNSVEKASEEKIAASGMPESVYNHKRFVNASSVLENGRYFDGDFFRLSKTEATLLDPQIRLLLQASYHAIEDAGYDLNRLDVAVGNFCGMSTNSYLIEILDTNALGEQIDPLLYRILNDKDFLATWISYKLNLTGPAMSLQTACSTSLLAVHQACQSLLNFECDMALAGGSAYNASETLGYVHVPESIFSKDGMCRPFDKNASGTIMGDGVGTVLLKRAADALADNDNIYALIKGTAVNNDGANKQGYTTPSVNYQRDMILEAISVADISPDTIGMIEAHGTGTLIGDPIEISALSEAYREHTDKLQYCAIGSVKGNIGHLDAAAGIASLIKTALCVKYGELVPNINFSEANPALNLGSSPFYISEAHTAWPDHFGIRRAGISSLGVGGTNVHVIVEQPPQRESTTARDDRPYVVGLSSMTAANLQQQKVRLADFLKHHTEISLADIENTTLYGRQMFAQRFSTVCTSRKELISQLEGSLNEEIYEGNGEFTNPVFLFPGQGSQYPGMGVGLYNQDEGFRKDMDFCFRYLNELCGTDFKEIVFSQDATLLGRTENTQVALFVVEYCLAKTVLRYGTVPAALIGHSLGEYVAACLAGIFSVEEALKLVYHRGRLMGQMAEGTMLLVRLSQDELTPLLEDQVSVCVINSDKSIVIGGPPKAIQKQSGVFDINSIKYKRLEVSHAYHTAMMQPALAEYEEVLQQATFNTAEFTIISTYTGATVDSQELGTPRYWLDQITNPVKFADAIKEATNTVSHPVFVEVGPGNGLSSFVKAILNEEADTVNLMPRTDNLEASVLNLQKGRAQLYAKGSPSEKPGSHPGRKISLPGYYFSKQYFWKPLLNVQYRDFPEIKSAYHQNQSRYLSNRLKTSVEVHLENEKISPELLEAMDELHKQYIEGIQKLFSACSESLHSKIQVMYDDTSFAAVENACAEQVINKKRPVSTVYVAPATEMEKSIAVYWESVLGYAPAGIMDNYFEAGGNSLLATKLMTQLSDEFEVELTLKELSETLNIKELATLITSKKNADNLVDMIAGSEYDDEEDYIEL